MQRRNTLAIVAAVAVGSTGLGWLAGQQIKSPAEIASETAPPTPSLITVPIESRTLSSTVIVRGTVTFDEQTQITVTGGEGAAIITRVPLVAGDQLDEGDVIVEVSGRPVIALAGELPVFRNFTPGLEGPDVNQLEAALFRLGFDPGTVDNRYDQATELAVEAFYRQLGYSPDEPGLDALATLDAARERVRGAQESLRIAELAVRNSGVATSTRLQLDQAVASAEQSLAIAVEVSRIARNEAGAAVVDAQNTYNADPSPENKAALDRAVAEQVLVNRQQDQAINDAIAGVEIAKALRVEGLANTNAEGANRQLSDARTELADAQADLARIDASIGVSVPAAEVVFLPTLPRTIQTVTAEPGKGLDGPVMTVSGSGTLIESAVSVNDRRLIAVGAEAIIDDDNLGISARATIAFIADNPGGTASSDRYAIRLEPVEPLPEEAYNQSLRVTIPIESTGGDVLAVPLAALSAGPDGSARVEVERTEGVTELVTVVPGLRAEGYVEITPTGGASLAAGDRVVVGRDLQLPTNAGDGGGNSGDDGSTSEEPAVESEGG